jgi:hypothetical protein
VGAGNVAATTRRRLCGSPAANVLAALAYGGATSYVGIAAPSISALAAAYVAGLTNRIIVANSRLRLLAVYRTRCRGVDALMKRFRQCCEIMMNLVGITLPETPQHQHAR